MIVHADYRKCETDCPKRIEHLQHAITELAHRLNVATTALQEACSVLISHHEEYPIHDVLARVHKALHTLTKDPIIVIPETTLHQSF